MPEHIRALFVVLPLASAAYLLTRWSLAPAVGLDTFRRRWLAWLALTLTLYLSHNQYIYAILTVLVTMALGRHERHPMALYLMLLLAAPPLEVQVPGFGIVNYLLNLTHSRLLALAILLPAAWRLHRMRSAVPFGVTTIDRLLLAFVLYMAALQWRDKTLTDTLRSLTCMALDVVLLYYVASRTLTSREALRELLVTCVTIGVLLSCLATFESARGWLLYTSPAKALGAVAPYADFYLRRDGLLRASVTTGQSIPLGYFLVVCLGALLHVQGYVHHRIQRLVLLAVLVGGLLASLARAPWLGAVLLFLVHALFAPQSAALLARRLGGLATVAMLAVLSPLGDRLIALLPWVGTVDASNVEYRERLLEAASPVFWRQPWTGSPNFLDTPEMQTMVQGQGIIDMVNTYLQLVMAYGAIGLFFFVLLFALGLREGVRAMRLAQWDPEIRAFAAALSATTWVVLIMIYTVSSITIIPTLYWLLLGALCALPRVALASPAWPSGKLRRI